MLIFRLRLVDKVQQTYYFRKVWILQYFGKAASTSLTNLQTVLQDFQMTREVEMEEAGRALDEAQAEANKARVYLEEGQT